MNYRRLSKDELEPHEEQMLLDECAQNPFGMQMQHLKEDIEKGLIAVFRWTGGFDGLMVVLVQEHPLGKEMCIWHLSGRGFLENIHEVRKNTKRLARELGCKWISAEARSMALARIYSRLSKMTAVKFLMEA